MKIWNWVSLGIYKDGKGEWFNNMCGLKKQKDFTGVKSSPFSVIQ